MGPFVTIGETPNDILILNIILERSVSLESGREISNPNKDETMMRILIFDNTKFTSIKNLAVIFINTAQSRLDGNNAYVVRDD